MSEAKLRSYLDLPENELQPMSDEQSQRKSVLLKIEEAKTFDECLQLLNDMTREVHAAASFTYRLQIIGALNKAHPALIMFLATTLRNFGEASLWAYTLHQLSKANGLSIVTFSAFDEAFPSGLPSMEHGELLWSEQKDPEQPANNKLDSPGTYSLDKFYQEQSPLI